MRRDTATAVVLDAERLRRLLLLISRVRPDESEVRRLSREEAIERLRRHWTGEPS